MKTWLVPCVVLTVLACGDAKNSKSAGDALATMHGTLTGTGQLGDPIHLSLLWISTSGADVRDGVWQPSLITQEQTYTGTFPISYAFDLREPPPPGALSTVHAGGVSYQQAYGVLLAYVDVNHNNSLDKIGLDGVPVDTVLAASVGDLADWKGPGMYVLMYEEGVNAPRPGYSLQLAGADVPLTTPIPLEVTSAPELNAYLCEAIWGPNVVISSPGSVCAPALRHPLLSVSGELDLTYQAYIQVSDRFNPIEAMVKVNGHVLTSQGAGEGYAAGPEVLQTGLNTVEVDAGMLGTATGSVFVPDAPVVTSPKENSDLPRAATPLTWSAVPGATEYLVDAYTDAFRLLYRNRVTEASIQLPALPVGRINVGVKAIGSKLTIGRYDIEGQASARLYVTFH